MLILLVLTVYASRTVHGSVDKPVELEKPTVLYLNRKSLLIFLHYGTYTTFFFLSLGYDLLIHMNSW